MNRRTKLKTYALALCLLAFAATAARASAQATSQTASQPKPAAAAAQPSTPTEVVRAYYNALKESRVRDAMMMSILRPAVESLGAEELKDFETDFARLAATAPADFEITGEQLSGEEATVFVRTGEGKELKIDPVNLIRDRGAWVVGDREGAAEVKKLGKKFFFEQRIATHESEAEDMLKRIQAAQLAYSLQNGGRFADLQALVRAGYVPQDILGTETTGYRFTVNTDGKTYAARAEPARYGHSGRLSFYMDGSGIQRKDAGGKPLSPPKSK
ncbi:MAG TPA: hypothetical protein VF588_00705 [Pyrinomonadaceae bacterium]|jgi:predicted RNA-binding protein YlxR (DUF448 family)